LGEQCADRFAFVESEGGDVDQGDSVGRVSAERGHDLTAVGVARDDRRAVLSCKHLPEPRDIIGRGGLRELGSCHVEPVCLEALDH
jgi:hypothetical protein